MENKCCCPFCEYEKREEKRKALHNAIDHYVRACVQKQQADNNLGVYEEAYAQKIEQLYEELKTRMEQQTEKPPYEKKLLSGFRTARPIPGRLLLWRGQTSHDADGGLVQPLARQP